MQPNWKFFLIQCDTVEYIADITHFCHNKNLALGLNRPGTFTFSMEMGGIWAPELQTVARGVVAHKNDVPVWAGPLWTKQRDFNNNIVEWSAVGWFQFLNKRILLESEVFDNIQDGDIAHELLEIVNSYHDTGITPGTQNSNASRDIEYEQFTNVGSAIVELTEVESGFDFTIDPIEKTLDIKAWDDYANRTDVLGYNWGPNNLGSFTESEEAETMVNEYFIVGETATAEANDSISANDLQLFQEEVSVSGNVPLEYLGAIANAELAVNAYPGVIYSTVLRPNTLSVFEDFNLGDRMQLVAKSLTGDIEIDESVRVFGTTISIDNEGNEVLTDLQTTYQGQ